MKRLSSADEKRAMKALEKCAAETKSITDIKELNEKAYSILVKELKDKPELLKRACEGYNSAKSIYKLSSANDNTRGDSFALLDAPGLFKRAQEDLLKGSLVEGLENNGGRKINFFEDKKEPVTFKKAASAETSKKEEKIIKLSKSEVKNHLIDIVDGLSNVITKSASAVANANVHLQFCIESFFKKLSKENASVRKEAAEYIHAAYGLAGARLINMFNQVAEPCGLNKIASYNTERFAGSVSLPDTDLYRLADDVIEANNNLKKVASIQNKIFNNIIKDSGTILAMNSLLKKEAAIAPLLMGAVGAKAVDSLGFTDPDEVKMRNDVNTTNLVNNLRELGARRAFMDMVLDETIARYPIEKIVTAYNSVLSELPINVRDIPATANKALIKARVIARLGRGGVPSQADADEVRSNLTAFSKLNNKDGQLIGGKGKEND